MRRGLLLLIIVLALAGGPTLAREQEEALALPGVGLLTPAESWVVQQAVRGGVADLEAQFGKGEGPRQLRAAVLEALLTQSVSGLRLHRAGFYLVNAVINGPLSLEFAEVAAPVFLVGCRFAGPVNCGGASFRKSLAVKQSIFSQQVNFHRLKVGEDAFWGDSTFQGPADFGGARIGGQFYAAGVRFADQQQGADFNGMTVGQSASFKKAVFAGPVDFTGVSCGGEFNLAGAAFENPDKQVLLSGLQVSQSASLHDAVFQGPVDLGGAEIKGELVADGAQFLHPRGKVNFNGIKAGPRASFDGTVFKGPVDFSMAAVSGLLVLHQTRFEHPEKQPNFFGLKVEQYTFISDTAFQAGVSLVGAQFRHLMLDGTFTPPLAYREVNLDGAQVDFSLILGNLAIDNLQASRLVVKGPAIFKNLHLNRADLRDSSFSSLKMLQVAWPPQPGALWLEGLAYQTLSAGEGPQDWRTLLGWVSEARFDSRSYSQLEAFFRHGGYQDRADEVYIEGKRRETLQQWWHPGNLATLVFWDGLAGYGKKPGRTFWLSLIIVLVGTLFFDHRNFDPSFVGGWKWLLNGSRGKTGVVRFFLSLDEFLPGVDLGLARLWQMNRISFPILLYYHFHKIAGWILVPVGLAAVYSQFK